MRPRPAVELTDEQIFWAGLKHFHCGFTIINGENYAFLSLFTKALQMDRRTEQWANGWTNGATDGRTQPLIEMRGRI